MHLRCLSTVTFVCFLVSPHAVPQSPQERGPWRAASSTARAITGDIAFGGEKIAISFAPFAIAQIRILTPAELAAVFPSEQTPATPSNAPTSGAANLYRLSIPATTRFLHKNTLCGSDETQWMVTYVTGHTLQIAFFSGASIPSLTSDSVANSADLCGTFTYVR